MSEQDSPNPKDEESPETEVPTPMESEDSQAEEVDVASDGGVKESEPSSETSEMEASEPEERPDSSVDSVASSSNVLERGTLGAADEKTMGMLVHLLGGITYILGPLVIWLIKKDESPFVQDQGKEAINFQITVIIAFAVATATGLIPFIGGCIAPLLWLVVVVGNLIFAILGELEANNGIIYRYPFALRLVS